MKYGSVCSGIEAATVAWHPLGWRPAFFSEIDKFPSAVLAHHYPHVPNHGDMNKFEEWDDADIDVLVGGTPCQSYSVAGLRKGLDDPRGNLMLVYAAIARRYRPRWVAWENVPGVLSDDGGRSFATLLGLLSGQIVETPKGGWQSAGIVPGYKSAYGLAWRVLDAQYVRVDGFARAVPQRRKRVFVVGYLGDWRRAAAVLFERDGLQGNPAPRREAGQRVAPTLEARANAGGAGGGTDFLSGGGLAADGEATGLNDLDGARHALRAKAAGMGQLDPFGETFVAPVAFGGNNTEGPIDVATACRAKGGTGHGDFESETFVAQSVAGALDTAGDRGGTIQDAYGGRLLPVAAEAYDLRGREHGVAFEGPHDTASMRAASGGSSRSYVCFDETQLTSQDNRCNPQPGDPTHPLTAGGKPATLAFHASQDPDVSGDVTHPLGAQHNGMTNGLLHQWRVRRLTPLECTRLQGFPDDYFSGVLYRGKPPADGPIYKALGNSMACNVMRWLGMRIQMVDEIAGAKDAA